MGLLATLFGGGKGKGDAAPPPAASSPPAAAPAASPAAAVPALDTSQSFTPAPAAAAAQGGEFAFGGKATWELSQSQLMAQFNLAHWGKYTDDQRQALLQEVCDRYTESCLLPQQVPVVLDSSLDANVFGGFTGRCIKLNPAKLDNPYEALDTIAHEANHAVQYAGLSNAAPEVRALFACEQAPGGYTQDGPFYELQGLEVDSNNHGFAYVMDNLHLVGGANSEAFGSYLKGRNDYFSNVERNLNIDPDWYKAEEKRHIDNALKAKGVTAETAALAKKGVDAEGPDAVRQEAVGNAARVREMRRGLEAQGAGRQEAVPQGLQNGPAAAQTEPPPKTETQGQNFKAAETQGETPKAEAQPQELKKAEAQPQEPKVVTQTQEPKAETQTQEPKAEAQPQEPKAETQTQTPKAEAQPREPKTETQGQQPRTEAQGQTTQATQNEQDNGIAAAAVVPAAARQNEAANGIGPAPETHGGAAAGNEKANGITEAGGKDARTNEKANGIAQDGPPQTPRAGQEAANGIKQAEAPAPEAANGIQGPDPSAGQTHGGESQNQGQGQ